MSRTTASIMRINREFDKISGLDGIVADMIEEKEKEIKVMVEDILKNHSEASIFNYRVNVIKDKIEELKNDIAPTYCGQQEYRSWMECRDAKIDVLEELLCEIEHQ